MKGMTMRKSVLAGLAFCFLASSAWAADVKDFHKTWADAKKAAEAQGKPLYLHFTTTWCQWCRVIEKETYTSKAGSAALASFVTASLDCTVPEGQQPSAEAKANLEMMAKFGGDGFPFLAMVTSDGVVLNTVSGYVPPEPFARELDAAFALYKEWKDFQLFTAKSDKAGYEFGAKGIKIYPKVGQWDKAAMAAEQVLKLDPGNAKGDAAEADWVLLRAMVSQPPANPMAAQAQDTAVKRLAAEIRKLDPKNDKRVLQELLAWQAAEALGNALRSQQAQAKEKLLDEVEGRLTELTGLVKGYAAAQPLWFYLGKFNDEAGRKDKALAAMEKSLAVNPKSPDAEMVRKEIERIRGLPETLPSQPATAPAIERR
jgi:thioredoxin-related protein